MRNWVQAVAIRHLLVLCLVVYEKIFRNGICKSAFQTFAWMEYRIFAFTIYGTVAQVFFYRVGLRSKMCRNGSFIRILLWRQIYTVILILSEKKLLRILWQIYLLNLLEKALDTVFFYSAFRGIKKEEPRLKSEALAGDPSGIRTPDTLIKSQVLCQLS